MRIPITLKCLLEISVETMEGCAGAQRGGARRIELCADLSVGGLTPSEDLMRSARAQSQIPVFVMIRPRAGGYVYSREEFAQMRREIALAKRMSMDGVVLGVLTKSQLVDVDRTRELVEHAGPLPVTFHRAFDEVADLDSALEDVIKAGAARILTSGGAASAPEALTRLARLVAAAEGRITILPGGGINASNALRVVTQTGAREIHSGLGSVLAYGQGNYQLFEDEVRKLSLQLASLG